ncbi:MAG: glycosyltransferase [Pusillimonas sp.]
MTKFSAHRKPKIPSNKSALTGEAALARARRETERNPARSEGWRALALLLSVSEPKEARAAAQRALELEPDDPLVLDVAAQAEDLNGNGLLAIDLLKKACQLAPDAAVVHLHLGTLLYLRSKYEDALVALKKAASLNPGDAETQYHLGITLFRLQHYKEADEIFQDLIKRYPKAPAYWNEAGNIKRDLGFFAEAEKYYKKAEKLTGRDPVPLGNRITAMHYRPDVTSDAIFEVCKEWQSRFAPPNPPDRPAPGNLDKNRRLRIGMFSDGFRKHPVGSMTIRMLEARNPEEFEVFAYTTTATEDILTRRIKSSVEHWALINHLSDEEFAQRIRDDRIDILFDLCGYNRGNRMRVMAMQPAPLLVKWVGGLINTTGVTAIDYLMSDGIETPHGVDHLYTEKLIRLPDDYICFDPPPVLPDVAELPASRNGYITLGCFNNPIKVNEVILAQWAKVMHELPNSRLFLKGHQYESIEVCERIRKQMQDDGISNDRLIFEGPSLQPILLNAYNRVDIALDPWPYSGGLTTCEAMIMGVPVVTLPGPTFAGRHSATHLVNAGMPELVVNSWDEYRDRVVGLANDIENLAVIRQHLRHVLLSSPVCDGPRFAKNFSIAMRAIWMRYCDDKKPAALYIDHEQGARFEDEDKFKHIDLKEVTADSSDEFSFSLPGKILILDHGASFASSSQFSYLIGAGAFKALVFDPLSEVKFNHPDVSVVSEGILGDGNPAELFLTLDPELSGTLDPFVPENNAVGSLNQIVAKVPVPTYRLDDVQSLDCVDWLVLDSRHDNAAVITNASETLEKCLIVQMRVSSRQMTVGAVSFDSLIQLMKASGFELYRIDHGAMIDYAKDIIELKSSGIKTRASDYMLLFVPDADRLARIDEADREKLVFIFHTYFKAFDFASYLLALKDSDRSRSYLESLGLIVPVLESSEQEIVKKTKLKNQDLSNDAEQGGLIVKPESFRSAFLSKSLSPRKVVVGVPVYNEEKYIEETILSLKRQDYDDVLFLVSDNHSTDRSFEIISDVSASDNRFIVVRQNENIGAFNNIKFLFDYSKSKYFMWLGGHDYVSDAYFESLVDVLDSDKKTSMVLGMPYAVKGVETKLMKQAIYDFQDENRVGRYLKSVAQLSNCTVFQSLFRRDCLDGSEIRSTISADHVIISRLLWFGKLKYCSDSIYYRRYFSHRNLPHDERLKFNGMDLSRESFYDYYKEDFSLLCNKHKKDVDLIKNLKVIDTTLRRRFGLS